MFVILAYDISGKRVSKVMKTCKKYLNHIQKSVFEGILTEGELTRLKNELERLIEVEEDRIQIYRLDSLRYTSKEEIGISNVKNNII